MSNVEPSDSSELLRESSRKLAPESGRRKVGRPARINREIIGEAAHAIGLNDITLKAVAQKLGVSVAGLYHHVDGRDDLLRLAAEHATRRVTLPEDRGQHWAVWLREWAVYMREAFIAQPGLLGQYLEGAISAEAFATTADTVLGLLVRQGFTIGEAQSAYELVSSCAIGSAVTTIRETEATRDGRPPLAEHQRVLAQRGAGELPHLRQLVAELTTSPGPPFEENLTALLVGIAARQGEPWRPVADLLTPSPPPSPARPAHS
jgi:AcrR family transcriptional regulator